MNNDSTDLKSLRDRIVTSLARFQMMEDAADVMIGQATESGYRSGWHDAIMIAAQELRRNGYKSSAEIVEKIAEMAELPES